MIGSILTAVVFCGVAPAGVAFFLGAQTITYRREALQVEAERAARQLGNDENIDAFFDRYPNHLAVRRTWCQVALDKGFDTPEAIGRLAAFRRRFPRDAIGIYWQALALRLRGDIAQAELLLRSNMRRRPRPDALALFAEYAILAELRQDWAEARRRWRRVQVAFARQPHGFLGEAKVALHMADNEAAETLTRQALERSPTLDNIMAAFAEVAEARGDWTEAAARWSNFRIAHDMMPQGYLRGLNASYRAGHTREAAGLLSQIDLLFRNNPEALAQRDVIMAAQA